MRGGLLGPGGGVRVRVSSGGACGEEEKGKEGKTDNAKEAEEDVDD